MHFSGTGLRAKVPPGQIFFEIINFVIFFEGSKGIDRRKTKVNFCLKKEDMVEGRERNL